ncbi:MAG: DUF899 domain-containing protein [Kibdelosporangium sp.]
MSLPQVVTREEWLAARRELLAKEKAATRARDELNADRRRLPMVEIDQDYLFEGPAVGGTGGKVRLLDLFEGRPQLVVYHFMFDPEWDAGCRSCSAFLDQLGDLVHLRIRNTTLVAVSRAPISRITPFQQRMGWSVPWYSSFGSDFNYDFDVTLDESVRPIGHNYRTKQEHEQLSGFSVQAGESMELPGLSVFLREGDRVFHTYSTYARGLDGLGSTTSFLDLTALGRQEEWEEPKGRAISLGLQAGGPELRYHDEY